MMGNRFLDSGVGGFVFDTWLAMIYWTWRQWDIVLYLLTGGTGVYTPH